MKVSLAFDLFGTLVNTEPIRKSLENYVEEQAGNFYKLWRNKQLEYSCRKSLMNMKIDYSQCTKEALDYCCSSYDIYLSGRDKKNLLKMFTSLPAYPDAADTLNQAKSEGFKLYVLSNAEKDTVTNLLHHNQLFSYFDKIITAQEAGVFMPSPEVYEYFIQNTGCNKETCWFVSGSSSDTIGAVNAGMKTVWVQRSSDNIFDPWNIHPDIILGSLTDMLDEINTPDEEYD